MKRFFCGILGAVVLYCAFALGTAPVHAQFSYLPTLYNGPVGLCRLGINKVYNPLGSYSINPLRLGWFLDYTGIAANVPGVSYFPVIRLEQTPGGYNYSYRPGRVPASEAQLRALVATKPGLYWLIGNEPDRIDFQDDMEPHMYARAYHDLYHIIKDVDPTAKIVAGTIVQPTPVRLEYLDLVLESYYNSYKEAMPVDAWAFHNFILNELNCDEYGGPIESCWGADIPPGVDAIEGLRIDVQETDSTDLFAQQVIRFRQWMADRGYRNTPAFLTEFGVLMPEKRFNPDFDPKRVNDFMNWTFEFLITETDPDIGYPGDNNRLVQRFAWYSVDDDINHNGHLFSRASSTRTEMGDNFVNFASAMSEQADFYLDDLRLVGAPPLTGQGATTVTLEAIISNSGNSVSSTSTTVRFYNGNPNNGGVQIGSDQTVSIQGCGEQAAVRLEWGAVTPGDYTVYVQVQAAKDEPIPTNNQASLPIRFHNENLFIPKTQRALVIPE